MFNYRDLSEALVALSNEDKGITIFNTKDRKEYVSYKQLLERSRYLCGMLQSKGLTENSKVIIRCNGKMNFIYSFWACILGGFIAIPMDISQYNYNEKVSLDVYQKLGDIFLLSDNPQLIELERKFFQEKCLDLNELVFTSELQTQFVEKASSPEDIVCIQFSSGSTGQSRGVVLRKRNIVANVIGIAERLEIQDDDIMLSWQPLTHCYGLFVYHVLPILYGLNQYLIPTEVYMKEPLMWLELADKLRATRLGTIPFALKHYLSIYNKTANRAKLDLGCIRSITIGAEQVTKELCTEFVNQLAPCGLSNQVMIPLYGLAESVTVVGLQEPGKPLVSYIMEQDSIEIGKKIDFRQATEEEHRVEMLEIGKPLSTIMVDIKDDNLCSVGEAVVGHIFIKGDSVTTGYYQDSDADEYAKRCEGWFDTGDIGFMVNNRVTVIGREKELLIINGKKYSCIEVEEIVKKGLKEQLTSKIVACSGLNAKCNMEQSIIFIQSQSNMEVKKEREEFLSLSQRVRNILFESLGIIVDYILPIDEIPKTFSGKTQRVALVKRFLRGEFDMVVSKLSEDSMIKQGEKETVSQSKVLSSLVAIIEEMFHVKVTDTDLAFKDYGIISINIPPFLVKLNEAFHTDIKTSSLFNYPSIRQLANYIFRIKNENIEERGVKGMLNQGEVEEKIAIVGMSCRFPNGANSLSEFWELLVNGIDGITVVPSARWDWKKYYDENKETAGKMYNNQFGFLSDPVDEFDARFFNISPKEANALDPQQRLLLELTWEAFENASMDISKYAGSNTGVYIGMSTNEYALSHLYSGDLSRIDAYSLTGMCYSTACGRVSYVFGFEGPCLAIDTACSSSLSALHVACNALKAKESDMAVVAGTNLMASPAANIGFSKLQATSPEGHSKSFDASADGYARSEGGGVILVKRLSDAIRDNDTIWGVIAGSCINQDGRSNGLTAPNGASQERLIEETLEKCNLISTDVDYIEMHGTGTKLGDPIEVNAIMDTYCKNRESSNPLRIGSVKSNVGHLEAGAGMTSLMKVLLSFKHNMIPGNLHFNNPNPLIDWEKAPIEVVAKNTEWVSDKTRRAGINGFGFGGSNAHFIVEDYKQDKVNYVADDEKNYMLKVTARSKYSLNGNLEEMCNYLENSEDSLRDIVYSADRGRSDMRYRFLAVGKSKEELKNKIEDYLANGSADDTYCNLDGEVAYLKDRKFVFMFTGQGSQYLKMGHYLYENNKVFRESMDACDKLFKPYLIKSIVSLLYDEKSTSEQIEKTVYAQPLIFTIEYALFKVLESIGITPDVVMGHSIGEFMAAVAAGIIDLESAVKLVSTRGRLMDMAPGSGSMATVFANEEKTNQLIAPYQDKVSIAAYNAEESCVISGKTEVVDEIVKIAEEQGLRTKKLKVSHAFHSQLMEPILEDFKSVADEITYKPAKVRYVSALYARELYDDECLDGDYWTKHIRGTVDFYHSVVNLQDVEEHAFLEVGSNRVLSALCKLIFGDKRLILDTLNRKTEEEQQFNSAIAKIYLAGGDINWDNMQFDNEEKYNKCVLPNYVFEREKYWMEPLYDYKNLDITTDDSSLLGQKIESVCMENTVVFQRKFTQTSPFFMSEHIIFNTPISPAAAHTSMLLKAIEVIDNPQSATLREVELRAPLAINEGEERIFQVCVTKQSDQSATFVLASKDANNSLDKWLTHANGLIDINPEYVESEKVIDIEEVRQLNYDQDVGEVLYAAMTNTGFNLGDSFRRITKTNCVDGEGICLIEPLHTVPDLDQYVMYPGIIDCLFQTILCVVYKDLQDKGVEKNNKTIIPYFLGSITYNYRESDNLWCMVKGTYKGDIVYGEVTAFNEKGEVVVEIKDFTAQFTDADSLLREMNGNINNLYYHTSWQEEELKKSNKVDKRNYVVISDSKAFAEETKALLEEKQKKVTLAMQGENYETNEQGFVLDFSNQEQVSKFLTDVFADNQELRMVYSIGIDELSCGTQVADVDRTALKGILNLVKELAAQGLENKAKIKIVTKNVQNLGEQKEKNLVQSLLWGMSKVISIEASQVFDGIIDINDNCNAKKLQSELLYGPADEIGIYDGTRYVGRLLKLNEYKKQESAKKAIKVVPDASYVITGGTGALGMVYANVLLSKGAKNLILMARHTPKEDAMNAINELAAKWEAKIDVVLGDVCDKDSLQEAFKKIAAEYPEVKGVIHAAGVLRDKMLSDITWDEFETVLSAKVTGTINLYNALADKDLDFFMMLSSITSIIGNMGQSNYASANYFMNCFADYMQNNSKNGFTFCWGPWQEGGMANESSAIAKNMEQMGLGSITPEVGQMTIEGFMEQPYANVVIADVKWDVLVKNLNGKGKKEFLSRIANNVVRDDNAGNRGDQTSLLDTLKPLSKEDRKKALEEFLQVSCGKILGFSSSKLPDVDLSFREQGADSLMIFSIRNTINTSLDIELSASALFNYSTITKLVEYIVEELIFQDEDANEAEETVEEKSTEELLQELSKLTD